MSFIYDAAAIRKWDAFTIQHEPVTSTDLMERAAVACCKRILGSHIFNSATIICGKGNNGGDGLAIARILQNRGINITVYICEVSSGASAGFDVNLKRLPSAIPPIHLNEGDTMLLESDLVIDCIFGSGLSRPISGWTGNLVDAINNYDGTTISIDIPSGLYVGYNTENPLNHVVIADHTLSFQTPKFPFFFAKYASFTGKISILDIGLSEAYSSTPLAIALERQEVSLKQYGNHIHKGHKGYLTVIAGSELMPGAAILCSKAAFRTGCGYVGVMSHSNSIAALTTQLPEAIWLNEFSETLPAKTSAIAIGPGLGKTPQSKTKLSLAFNANVPLVVDADALNLLAEDENLLNQLPEYTILTPHLGELKRLIGDADSPEALLEKQIAFSKKHAVYIIQKGAYSKLTSPEGNVFINTTGNPGMASAGMGDALTGMIGAFLAQGYSPLEAAKNGMYYHGLAGDKAVAKIGRTGLLASDLIGKIPAALNGL